MDVPYHEALWVVLGTEAPVLGVALTLIVGDLVRMTGTSEGRLQAVNIHVPQCWPLSAVVLPGAINAQWPPARMVREAVRHD